MVGAASSLAAPAGAEPGRGVLIVTAHFPPSRTAGTHRLLRFANDLDALGWDVTVLTLSPDAYRPGIAVDTALNRLVAPGVHVTRTGVPGRRARASRQTGGGAAVPAPGTSPLALGPARRSGPLRRALGRFWQDVTSTPDRELAWWPAAVRAGGRIARSRPVDVILSSAPPFTTHLIASSLSQRLGVPWLADFRDPWSRAPWGLAWRNQGWTGAVHRTLEKRTVRRASRIVLNTGAMRDDFVEHHPEIDPGRFHAIPNGFDSAALAASVVETPPRPPGDGLVLCHAGALYQARDPRPLLSALASVRRSGRVPPAAWRLQLVGGRGGEFETTRHVRELGIEDVVEFVPPVSHGQSLGYLRAADVLLVIQPDTRVQVPSKLYEYLWARKPILALASEGAVADIVRDGRVGLVADPADSAAIAEALVTLYERRAQLADDFRADEVFLAQFEGRTLSRQLHEHLTDLVHGAAARTERVR